MDFSKNYILESQKVKLEPLIERHINELKVICSEKKLWTYFVGKSNGKDRLDYYISDALKQRANKNQYSFAVYDKDKKQYAGSTRFFDFSENNDSTRMGYTWYGKDFRGTGLNKHCKYLMFEFAFERLRVERIGLGAHSENIVSIAAMKSVGCKKEGVIRNLFPSIDTDGRADAVLFGIIRKEWFENVKYNLENKL